MGEFFERGFLHSPFSKEWYSLTQSIQPKYPLFFVPFYTQKIIDYINGKRYNVECIHFIII